MWLAYAQLVRLPNVFTAMADICLAGVATGAILDQTSIFLLLLLASSALYCGGMAWNDYFDLEQDLRERPGRPIPSGRITARNAFLVGACLNVLGLSAAALADFLGDRAWHSFSIACLLVLCIVLYDGVLKRTWAGPYLMGACRFFNVLLGLSAPGTPIAPWGYLLALSVGVYIVGVTWFAKTEARLSKQSTLLTAALVMAGGLFLGMAVPALTLETDDIATSPLFLYLLVSFALYLGLKIIPAVRNPQPSRVQSAVKRAVLGLVLLDAILATAIVGVGGLAIAVLLAPAQFLSRWLYST